jgi:hypothetical protein
MKTSTTNPEPIATPAITGSHLRTYETIFQHPISHNLEWHAVHALLGKIGHINEEPNGNFKVTRNGHSMVLHPHRSKNVADVEELMALRHFIERSASIPPQTGSDEGHWLLVIDHHQARVFRSEMHGAIPQRILPHDPKEYFRHAPDSKEVSNGKEKPDPNSFFEPVAKALQGASQLLIFGTGTGMSSEMDQFIEWVKVHHPDLAGKIIGSLAVDEHHLTENQLLAKAREFYTGHADVRRAA